MPQQNKHTCKAQIWQQLWLVLVDIEPGRSNATVFQSRHQRLVVDYATAGDVDQNRRGFHARELRGADQVMGRG